MEEKRILPRGFPNPAASALAWDLGGPPLSQGLCKRSCKPRAAPPEPRGRGTAREDISSRRTPPTP